MSRKIFAVLALMLAGIASQASAGTVQVTILSKKLWAKTGVQVHAGDLVTITAAGSWTWGADYQVGPDGDMTDDYNAFDLFQPFDFFSQARVIAYVGNIRFRNAGAIRASSRSSRDISRSARARRSWRPTAARSGSA